MGNKKDGKPVINLHVDGNMNTMFPDLGKDFDIEIHGNTDAKILAKSFEELSKDGLSKTDRQNIEKFDDILTGADIVINKAGTGATIVQEDGQTFTLNTPKGRGK